MPRAGSLRLSLVVTLLHLGGGRVARAQSRPDTVLVEVRIGAVASETMFARRQGDDLRLPRGAVLALAELAPRLPSGATDTFVPLDTIRALLHESVELDWTALTITVSDSRTLPVSRRIAREALHAALRDASSPARTASGSTLAPRAVSLDYTIAAGADPRRDVGATLRFGAAILGGALDVGWRPRLARASARDVLSITWLRPIDQWSGVRQLRIGDRTAIPIAGVLRDAVVVSNAPPVRDAGYGSIPLDGTATPGAAVEVVANGALAAWTIADARGVYRLPVPLGYGANRLSITAYDSSGGERLLGTRDITVADGMLRAGAVQYTLASGRCAAAHCDASVAELRAAPSEWLTVGIAQALQRDSAGYSFRSELGTWVRPSDAVTIAVQSAPHAATRVSVAAGTSPSAAAIAALRWRPRDGAHVIDADRLSGIASLDWLPFANQPRIALRASGVFRTPPHSARARIALGVTGAAFRIEPFVRLRARGEFARAPATSRATPIGGGVEAAAFGFGIGIPVALHARAGDGVRVLSASLVARSGISLDANALWRTDVRRPTIQLSVARRLPAGRYGIAVAQGDDTHTDIRQTLDGSFVADLSSVRVRAVSRSGFGALRGHVFVDADHDGVRDPGELVLQGVELSVAGVHAETDARGEYSVWELSPLVPLLVRIESLPPPYVVTRPSLSVRVLPDGVTVLDVPVDGP